MTSRPAPASTDAPSPSPAPSSTVPSSSARRDGPRWPVAIFDLDGTLADTVELIVASYQYAFRTVTGREEDPDVIRSWIGRPLHKAFREHCPEQADELHDTYLTWNADNTERLIRGYDGVADVLAGLRAAGVRIAVATSKRRESAQQAMDILGLSGHVEALVALEDTEIHKPDPAPLLLALTRLGERDPSHAVYVGDAVVDVLAGKAAGMSTVCVTWGAGTRDALTSVRPDATASTVAELGHILGSPARAG